MKLRQGLNTKLLQSAWWFASSCLRCTMAMKATKTNIKGKAKAQIAKGQARKPNKPFCLFVRKGVRNRIGSDRCNNNNFGKMDWSKLYWKYVDHACGGHNGSECDAECFIAHHLIWPLPGQEWALCTMARKVIPNCTKLYTFPSGTKLEYWKVSDLPKCQQSNCTWWSGED